MIGGVREVLSLPSAGTGTTPERDGDLHALRPADSSTGASAGASPVAHAYDGTMNDGFCAECGQSRERGAHSLEAWRRSLRIQRAQREYEYCARRPRVPADEFFTERT